MSDFTFSCGWVLNPGLPHGARFNAFVRCCSAFGKLTGSVGMQEVYDRLGAELGFGGDVKPTIDQLVAAIGILVTARSRLHHERRLFEMNCRREKRAGRRWKGRLYEGLDPISLLKARRGIGPGVCSSPSVSSDP